MKNTHTTKPCTLCGKPFTTTNHSKRYCDTCTPIERGKLNNKPQVTRDCAVCGEPFSTSRSAVRVCSTPCSKLHHLEKLRLPMLPARPCQECGAQFMPKNKNSNFCQATCRQAFNRKKAKERGRQRVDAEASCLDCGVSFIRQNSLTKFCPTCCQKRRIGGNKTRTAECKHCQRLFSSSGRGRALYCGPCREKYPSTIPRPSKEPCVQCGKPFTHKRMDARFCSFKCSSLWINATGQGPRHDDGELLARIVSVINSHERCLSQEELLAQVGISHQTLQTREWSMEFLYNQADRTYDAPVLDSRFADRVYSVLSEIVTDMEMEPDKPLPGMRGFKDGELRADIFIKDLNLIVEADGGQHQDGRGDLDQLAYIRANDRLKDLYAAANGITLIRIPYTLDCRSIKAQLLRGIRRAKPRFRPLKPSNASGPARRMPARRETSNRPKLKRGEKGEPLLDIYCRGCHERPSYKHRKTYLCSKCWERSGELWLTSRFLQEEEIPTLKDDLVAFIKSRGRYVWQPEVYLYFRAVSSDDFQKHGINVATICRELGLFAPADDRITRETAQRVSEFALSYFELHGKMPSVGRVVVGSGVSHINLWSCMDYDEFVRQHGGKLDTDIRYRFRDPEEFLDAAAEVVTEAGRWLPMSDIVKKVGICYPAYLSHFKSVRSKEIHEKAGISKTRDRPGPR